MVECEGVSEVEALERALTNAATAGYDYFEFAGEGAEAVCLARIARCADLGEGDCPWRPACEVAS